MFDSHCHLDFAAFDDDRDAVVARARSRGVTAVHVPGVGPDQWAKAAALQHAGIGSSVGIHPQWLASLSAAELEDALASLQVRAGELGAEAIGEVGLDAFTAKKGPDVDAQVAVLDAHIEVAKALELPIVLHVLGPHGKALATLKRHAPLPAGGVLHSYSGPAEMVAEYSRLGLFFGFAAAVTRANARRPLEAARAVPAERLLIETDGPDQALAGHERGSPEDLPAICAAVARARGEEPATVAALTEANARRLFRRPSG
ncbi:MAG TPA: TatD family deoxyribonuclease [Polyangiaceae bacterium]|nr:TatD family deoxyribonuclease [Polyangiaceae bacterium]